MTARGRSGGGGQEGLEAIATLAGLVERFLEGRRIANYAASTIEKNALQLGHFVAWCEEREVRRPPEVTKEVVERYQRWLFDFRRPDNGRPYAIGEQAARLHLLRAFFRWLLLERVLLADPAVELELPRREVRLPEVYTPAEVAQVLDAVDVSTGLGIRDRAMLEVFYSTGLRRSEVAKLHLYDVDQERGVVTVRRGKGRKDRLVPIGERALLWLQKYLRDVRPELVGEIDHGVLFVSQHTGGALRPQVLSHIGRRAVKASGVKKGGACHFFRHAMATGMLDGGADIRHIQQILGHASVTTTQIYTAVSMEQLRRVHAQSHPEGREAEGAREAELETASSARIWKPHPPGRRRRRRTHRSGGDDGE